MKRKRKCGSENGSYQGSLIRITKSQYILRKRIPPVLQGANKGLL
jgi:hypothetical protein